MEEFLKQLREIPAFAGYLRRSCGIELEAQLVASYLEKSEVEKQVKELSEIADVSDNPGQPRAKALLERLSRIRSHDEQGVLNYIMSRIDITRDFVSEVAK